MFNRTIQEMLFCDFLEFYQTCLDAIPPVPGLEISSPELVKEVGILIGRMDADNCRKAERIVAEFKKQFDILERVSHQHSMQKTLSTFVFELPGNLLTLLRKVYTLPDDEIELRVRDIMTDLPNIKDLSELGEVYDKAQSLINDLW